MGGIEDFFRLIGSGISWIFRQIATFFEKVVFPCINWVCTRIGWFLSWFWDKFIKFVKFAVELLWEITKFVLRRLFDAFGVLSLVLSCLAVWRLKTIYDCMFTLTFFHNEWKEDWAKREYSNVLFDGVVILESEKADNILMWQLRAFNVLLMSLQSTVNLCILPFILLSPLRWRQIKSSFVEYCGISNKDTTFHKYTTDLFDNFEDFSDLIFPAVGDIISYPFILFTTLYPEVDYVFPFISFPMVPRVRDVFSMIFSLSVLSGSPQCELYDAMISKFKSSCILFSISCTAGRAFGTLFLPFAILTPTAWQTQWHTHSHLNENYRKMCGVVTSTASHRMDKFRKTLAENHPNTREAKFGNTCTRGNSISTQSLTYFMEAFDATMSSRFIFHFVRIQLHMPYVWRMIIDAVAVFPAIAAYCSPIRHRQFLLSKDLCEYQQMHYLAEYFPEKYVGTVILPEADNETNVDLGERNDTQTTDTAAQNLAYLTNSDGPSAANGSSLIDMNNREHRKRVQSGFSFHKCTSEEYDMHREWLTGWRHIDSWTKAHSKDRALEDGLQWRDMTPSLTEEQIEASILEDENLTPYIAPERFTLPTAAYRSRSQGPWSYFDTYNFAVRKTAIYYGVLAIFDLLLLPFMFPLYVTEYRWVPIQKALDSHDGSLQPNDILQILKQTFFLLMDGLVLIPTLPFLWITKYRYSPVQEKINTNFVDEVRLTCQLYGLAYKQFFMLLLDCLILLPTLPLVFVYTFRSKEVKKMLESSDFAKEVIISFDLYFEALSAVFFMCLDALILIPLVPILWVTRLRWSHVKTAIVAAFEKSENSYCSYTMYGMTIGNTILLCIDALLFPFIGILFITRIRYAKIMNIMYKEDLSAVRFIVKACILFWFACAVSNDMYVRHVEFTNLYSYPLTNTPRCTYQSFGTTLYFYWSVIQSFMILTLDIVFIPFQAVLFATVLHWPGVYNSIKRDMKHNYMTDKETDYEYALGTYVGTFGYYICVCVDIAMIPLVIILMVTQIRWFPVWCDIRDAHIRDPELGWRSGGEAIFTLWGSIVSSFLQLFLDLAVLPLALVVLVTWYRSFTMRQIWSHPYIYYIGINWHQNVIANFLHICISDTFTIVVGLVTACIPIWTRIVLRMLHFSIFREYRSCDMSLAFKYNEYLVRLEFEKMELSFVEDEQKAKEMALADNTTAPQLEGSNGSRISKSDEEKKTLDNGSIESNLQLPDIFANPSEEQQSEIISGKHPMHMDRASIDLSPLKADRLGLLENDKVVAAQTAYVVKPFPAKLDYRTWLYLTLYAVPEQGRLLKYGMFTFGFRSYAAEFTSESNNACLAIMLFYTAFILAPIFPMFLVLTASLWRAGKIWPSILAGYHASNAETEGFYYAYKIKPQHKIEFISPSPFAEVKADLTNDDFYDDSGNRISEHGTEVPSAETAVTEGTTDSTVVPAKNPCTSEELLTMHTFADTGSELVRRAKAELAFLGSSSCWDEETKKERLSDRKVVEAGSYGLEVDAYTDFLVAICAKIWGQFLFLVKDTIAVFPFAVVVMTLYRLLPFVIDAIAKSGAKPLTDVKPLFTVMSMKWTFKDKTNPCIEMELLPTEQADALEAAAVAEAAASAALENAESASSGNAGDKADEPTPYVVPESPIPLRAQKSGLDTDFWQLNVPLQVYCSKLFDLVGIVFGATAKSIGQAFLPLTLHGDVYATGDIEMREFQAKVLNYKGEGTIPFVMNIPAKKPKKTSLAKKLHSLKDVLQDGLASDQANMTSDTNKTNDLTFVMQVECTRTIKSTKEQEKCVIFRICPSIYELTAAADSESGVFESNWKDKTGALSKVRYYQAAKDDLASSDKAIATWDQDNDFIDNFALMSWMAFAEILIDCYHLLLTCFLIFMPWRLAELAYNLLFTKLQHVPYNYASRVMACLEYGETHLNDYVRELLPMINATAKMTQDPYHTFGGRKHSEFGFAGWRSSEILHANASLSSRKQKKLETWTICKYIALRKRFKLHVSKNTEWLSGIEFYEEERHALHERFIHLLGIKLSVLRDSAKILHDLSRTAQLEVEESAGDVRAPRVGPHKANKDKMENFIPVVAATINAHLEENKVLLAKNRRNLLICYQNIADHCHKDTKVKGIPPKLSESISAPINEKFKLPDLKKSNKICLFHQPIAETRAQIRKQATAVVKDAFIIFFGLCLVFFPFSSFGLIRELREVGSIDVRRYTVKSVIEKHITLFYSDLKSILKAIFWICVCASTVVSFLPFLQEVPEHMESFDEVAALAKEYASQACCWLAKSFLYLITGRTYYLMLNTSLYAALVPAACIGDVIYQSNDIQGQALNNTNDSNNQGKGHLYALGGGTLLWGALAVGAFLATSNSRKAGLGDLNLAKSVDSSMLMVGMLFLFFFLALLFVRKRKSYQLPAETSKTAPSFSYHMFLALLTPLFETAQLAGVIIYFFWSTSTYEMALTNDAVGQSGAWASRLYSWGNFGGGPLGFKVNMNIAVFVGLVWVAMITLPVTVQGEEQTPFCGLDGGPIYDQKELTPLQRATNIRMSSMYKFLSICITRLFTVWLMASLLRPISCMSIPSGVDAAGATTYSNVLSTLPGVACGGGTSWTSVLACFILVHLIVTTTSVGADDADLLTEHQTQGSEASGTVKFSPLYALQVRACQFFTVAACMGGFTASNRNLPLGAALAACILMALLPFAHEGCCSFKALVPFRSTGALGCAWAIAICMYRHSKNAPSDYVSGILLFAGWGVLLVIGCILYKMIRSVEDKEWMAYLREQGFEVALTNLEEVAESLMVQESGVYSQIASRAEEQETVKRIMSGKGGSRSTILARERHKKLKYMISTCNTIPKLAIAVAEIEDKCQFERLKPDFMLQRMSFHYNLLFHANIPILYPTKNQQKHAGTKGDASSTIMQRAQLANMNLKRVVFAIDHLRNNIANVVSEDVDIKIAISEALLRKNVPANISSIVYSFLDVVNADGIRLFDEFITKDLKNDINFTSKTFKFTDRKCMRWVSSAHSSSLAGGFSRRNDPLENEYAGALRGLFGFLLPSTEPLPALIPSEYYPAEKAKNTVDTLIENALTSFFPVHALNIMYVSSNPADLNHLFDAPENLSNTLICKSIVWSCDKCYKKCVTEEPEKNYTNQFRSMCPSCNAINLVEQENERIKRCREENEKARVRERDEEERQKRLKIQSNTQEARWGAGGGTVGNKKANDSYSVHYCKWHPACTNVAPKFRDTCGPCNRASIEDANWKHPKYRPAFGPPLSEDDFYDENGNRISEGGSIIPPPQEAPPQEAPPQEEAPHGPPLSDDDFYDDNGNRISEGGSIVPPPEPA